MDDDRKKRIAEHIRRRVGVHESMAALLSGHGIKHAEWMESAFANSSKDGSESDKSRSSDHKDTSSSERKEKGGIEVKN